MGQQSSRPSSNNNSYKSNGGAKLHCQSKNRGISRGISSICGFKTIIDSTIVDCCFKPKYPTRGEPIERRKTRSHKLHVNRRSSPRPGSNEGRNEKSKETKNGGTSLRGQLSNHGSRKRRTRPRKNLPARTKSEPNLRVERTKDRIKCKRNDTTGKGQFGYDIKDVEEFLTTATLNSPANIPIVLAFPTILYQTLKQGYQAEIALPLGMVVNAIFKIQNWLYVQTPHAEEGYVSYSACLPLGIIPSQQDDKLSPCWEKSTDVFPKPLGNATDSQRWDLDREEDIYCPSARHRTALSTCGEKSVDRLYLRAAAIAKERGTRHTLLIISDDYKSIDRKCLSVMKNEVVVLLNASIQGWFYIKNKQGLEGFIPSAIAGHGFL